MAFFLFKSHLSFSQFLNADILLACSSSDITSRWMFPADPAPLFNTSGRSVLCILQLESRERQTRHKGTVCTCVYAVYYVFLNKFRTDPIDGIISQTQHLQVVVMLHLMLERWGMSCCHVHDVTCLFCVNLWICFIFFLSVLSALHETDGGNWHFPYIFVCSIIKTVHVACNCIF